MITGEKVVVNTGARPFIPPVDRLRQVDYLDSTSIMELSEVPDHLIVLGGGYVGLEFGQMFRRFGARVSIIQRGDQLLPREDADIADEIARILRDEGIELLVATGRRPNTDDLNLGEAGIATDERGHVKVTEQLETSADGVWAIGDVKGGPAFTHISYDDYRILRDNWLEDAGRTIEDRLVPYTVFIDPQLGRVGLTEEQARSLDQEVRVVEMPMSHVARALEIDETRGLMKAVVDAETDQILGAAVLGREGGEIMSVLQMAMMGEVPATRIAESPFAHPTFAESLNNLFAKLN